ncbi:MAG: DMT family transporter [Candidatus Helarchaeota archaeon]
MSKNIEVSGYIFIILSVFIWSLGEIFLKIIQDYIGVFSYTFLRMLIGGTFLLCILVFQRDFSGFNKMIKDNLSLIILTCCIILPLSNILFFLGITNTLANMGAVLCSTSPVWITIFAFIILNEKNNLKTKMIGITIGIIGVTILLTEFNFSGFLSSTFIFGNLMALSAETLWSLYSVLGKKIQQKERDTSNHEIKFTSLSFLLGSTPIFIILIFTPEFTTLSPKSTSFLNYPLEVWLYIILLGVVFSGLAYILFFKGLRKVDTSKGASLIFLKPIISTIFAFIILNESPTLFLVISSILIIIAIYIINQDSKMEEETVISF